MALYRIAGTNLLLAHVRKLECSSSDSRRPGMGGLLGKLKERFDLVLIDSPPATLYPDGLSIVNKVDGVVLVVRRSHRWPVQKV